MNILLAIDESAGLRVLRHLGRGPHRVVGALVPSVSARSEGIHGLAERRRVPVYPGRAARDPHVAGWIRSQQVDLLISVHFSDIVRPENIASPRIGAFNPRPGPLPRCAGLNPVSGAIFHGEVDDGVTLHWLSRGIDAGPIEVRGGR